jgi:hypothetical protein
MSNKNKLVLGVGINDLLTSSTTKAYSTWYNMIRRCYPPQNQIRNYTYIGCTVCDEWLVFSNFKKWHDENYREGFHLDKDILIEDNKVYSPDTCVFVPQYLNSLLTDSRKARGECPVGVSRAMTHRQKTPTYTAQCSNGFGKQIYKTVKTIEEAKQWYSITKTRIVAEQVQRALSEGAIDQRVAKALLARKF